MLYETLIFISLVILNFGLILTLVYLGKEYLYGYTMLTGGFIVMLVPVSVEVFGFPFALVEVLFAGFFLITDVISELYGKQQARRTVKFALFGMLLGLLLSKIGAFISPSEFDLSNGHLLTVSGMYTPLALFVVAFAFVFDQMLDIYNFDRIRKWTKGKYLWLRNIGSTTITQTVDAFIVYPIFFYPVIGSAAWQLMLAAIVFKIGIAFIDTPFMYLARKVVRT